MSCNEAIQAFMALISPDSLQSATSSLLLVRAQLWHYALEKVITLVCACVRACVWACVYHPPSFSWRPLVDCVESCHQLTS